MRRRACPVLLCLLLPWSSMAQDAAAPAACATLIERSNAQLDAMRLHAESIDDSLRQLSSALRQADQRNLEQTRLVEQLQAELQEQRQQGGAAQHRLREDFFRAARRQLRPSSLYEILSDRIVVASDPIFIFGKGEIGAEGRDRLAPLVDGLRRLVDRLPAESPWRLAIEGHSDSRPLRANRRFASNWELSAARAVGVVRFLSERGIPESRLAAVGLSSTGLRDSGDSAAAHRRNRRIEIHLVFEPAG
ncbi:MAG: OmpA family protein [Gammaproteobacteria bacterium]|nr:OmpA family protein [Gammaproteobacteria bacterium]